MANFCTNCGNKLGKDDNFCIKCGTKIDKSDIKQNNPPLKSTPSNIEKQKAKKELKRVVGGKLLFNTTFNDALYRNGLDFRNTGTAIRQQVENEIDSGQIKSGGVKFRVNQLILEYKIEKENEKKKLKIIDEIFESEEIRSEIIKNRISQTHVIPIKDRLKNKIINKKENMSEYEIKHFIKKELKKVIKGQKKARIIKEKEMSSKKIEKTEISYGGYCDFNCIHCYEEFLDSDGEITGNFTADGNVEYYCTLNHDINFGNFCEDYE